MKVDYYDSMWEILRNFKDTGRFFIYFEFEN